MILFQRESVGAKLLRVFWLFVGIALSVGGFNRLLIDGIGTFIPWTFFLIGIYLTFIAALGSQEMLKGVQL